MSYNRDSPLREFTRNAMNHTTNPAADLLTTFPAWPGNDVEVALDDPRLPYSRELVIGIFIAPTIIRTYRQLTQINSLDHRQPQSLSYNIRRLASPKQWASINS